MMKKQELTPEQQIKGLELIMKDGLLRGDSFIHREYILEKLRKIREGTMIFHQSVVNKIINLSEGK